MLLTKPEGLWERVRTQDAPGSSALCVKLRRRRPYCGGMQEGGGTSLQEPASELFGETCSSLNGIHRAPLSQPPLRHQGWRRPPLSISLTPHRGNAGRCRAVRAEDRDRGWVGRVSIPPTGRSQRSSHCSTPLQGPGALGPGTHLSPWSSTWEQLWSQPPRSQVWGRAMGETPSSVPTKFRAGRRRGQVRVQSKDTTALPTPAAAPATRTWM